MFGLKNERSIWIEQEDLGKYIVIKHNKKRYEVKIPQQIDSNLTLRLRGLGKTEPDRNADLILHLRLNKGEDIRKNLWLSQSSAAVGAAKLLYLGERRIQLIVPPQSRDGLIICLKGAGRNPGFDWRSPLLHRKRGDLLVTLYVFPDYIVPRYESFETLTTEDMAMEGWIYRKRDEITAKIGAAAFSVNPLKAEKIADLYNDPGWFGIFQALVSHLSLTHLAIEVEKSDSISMPGNCQQYITLQNNNPVGTRYQIKINERFMDNPFLVAAILAHELCHVVYYERIDNRPRGDPLTQTVTFTPFEKEPDTTEIEHTVDLLVFMYKLGEFQLRVARDKRLTLGYFNQAIFDRIQVIASRKPPPVKS